MSAVNKYLRRQGGFTLVEVAIILLTLAILSAIMIPNLGSFNRLAQYIRVKEDLQVLCTAMKAMLDDIGESAFYRGPLADPGDIRDRDEPIGLLIGDGDLPGPNVEGTDSNWRNVDDEDFEVDTDLLGDTYLFETDTFANHLIQNTPVDSPARYYRTPAHMFQGAQSGDVPGGLHFDPDGGQAFNSLFAWRGPYINDRVVPDPWGNRYAANVFALFTPKSDGGAAIGHDGYASAVVCYSAGPDEEVDTVFNQPLGWFTGDDDHTVILNGGGW